MQVTVKLTVLLKLRREDAQLLYFPFSPKPRCLGETVSDGQMAIIHMDYILVLQFNNYLVSLVVPRVSVCVTIDWLVN